MNCDRVQPLVPVYVDGELKEELAAPLRRHLLECPDCRAVVAETKVLARWFVPTPEVAVPAGFAARVARRAFAGDEGMSERDVLVPMPPPADRREAPRLSRFAMNLTAVAAALLIGLTLLLAGDRGPGVGSNGLQAAPTEAHVLQHLEALNQRDVEGEPADDEEGLSPNELAPIGEER